MTSLLRVTGLVPQPKDFDFETLAKLPGQVPDISGLIPGRQGGAVRLASVLEAASASVEARHITLEAEGGSFSASVPLQPVLDQGLVVYRKGSDSLPVKDGGPVRFYIIDVEACGIADIDRCANVKYLGRIHLSEGPGADSRPSTETAHEALHRAERG